MTADHDLPRCPWADRAGDPLMAAYHDDEWGVRVTDDRELFEKLSLDAFQAGLSWRLILHRRDAFRRAFRDFEPSVVARFDAADVERLLADPGIVRNRAKVEATIGNAARFLELVAEVGSFRAWLERLAPPPPSRLPPTATLTDVPARTATSDAVSAALRARGFRFVGSTVVYAFMQAVALVDDHLPGCWRYGGDSAASGLHFRP
jgi:DNA-3-methyladenine glycosylase I